MICKPYAELPPWERWYLELQFAEKYALDLSRSHTREEKVVMTFHYRATKKTINIGNGIMKSILSIQPPPEG